MTTTKQILESINLRLGAIELRVSALGGGKPAFSAAETARPSVMCSFCGRTAREAKVVVAGPYSYICDECVGIAAEIVAEQAAKTAAPAPAPGAEQEPNRCVHCGVDLEEVGEGDAGHCSRCTPGTDHGFHAGRRG